MTRPSAVLATVLMSLLGCQTTPTAAPREAPLPIPSAKPLEIPRVAVSNREDAAYEALMTRLNVRQRQHLVFCTADLAGVKAIDSFLATYPNSPHQERVLYLAALSRWNLARYRDAAVAYRSFLAVYPRASLSNLSMTRLIQSLIRSDQAQAALGAVEEFEDQPGANQRQLHQADALALAGQGEEAAALLAQWIDTEELAGGNRRVIEVAAQQLERLSLIGKPLPAFEKTGYPDDEAISPAAFKGTVLLIDFWASWCGPCMAQMPHLVKIHQRLHKDGFQILGISLDDDDAKMSGALKRVGATWPQYYDGKRWENDLAVLFDVHRVPQTILVDREGIVRAVDPPPPAIDRLVTDLLGEGAPVGGP